MKDRDVANEHVATILESYRFVPPTRFDCISRIRITERSLRFVCSIRIQRIVLLLRARLSTSAHETFPPDHSRSKNRNVRQVLAPNQTVMPVGMTEILIGVPLVWFRRIVPRFLRRIGCDDRRALIEIQRDVALQVNRH